MKKIKKMLSIMLAMAMTLAMSVTAFAGEATDPSESTPENKPTAVTHTYEIYQIFTGDYADGVLSNIKWGQNGNGYDKDAEEQAKVEENILKELEDVTNSTSDTDKLAVIQKYAKLDTNPIQTGSVTKYTGLTPGYYLVKDKDNSLNGQDVSYTLYVVQVVNNTLEFTPKADIPTPDKKIVEGENKVDTNEASIGDEVKYEIVGTMPSTIGDYKEYFYKFTDTLSKGLNLKETDGQNDIKVQVGTKAEDGTISGLVDVTSKFYKNATEYSETDGTTITVSIQDVKALGNMDGITIDAKTVIVVTYTAVLNENAVIAGEGNPNDVKLEYSNNPNDSGKGTTEPPKDNPNEPKPTHPTGESPEVEVVTYTTELTILKTNEEGAFLPGVEFTLTGEGVNIVLVTEEKFEVAENGEYWKLADGTFTKEAPITKDQETETVSNNEADYDSITTKYTKTTNVVAKGNGETKTDVVGTVQADGTVTFKGLGAGEYTITETKTLPGYNTIDPITFTLTFDASKTPMFASNNDRVTVGTDNMLDTSIENKKGSLLPSTGGIGTTIFYIVGAVLVIGAAILLVTKKRMSKEA